MRLGIAIVFCLMMGCKQKPTQNAVNDNTNTTDTVKINTLILDTPKNISLQDGFIEWIEDTLQYLTKRKSFSINHPDDFYKIKGFTVDGNTFCAIITSTHLYVYQCLANKFNRVHREEYFALTFFSAANIKLQDLNWDGYIDINIRDSDQEPIHSAVLLYNPQSKTYKRTPYMDLTNISLDNKNHFIRAHNQRGSCWPAHKTLYRYTADSIELYKRVVCDPKCYKGGDITLTIVENKNGVTKEDSIVGNPHKLWSLYDTMLWDLKRISLN